MIGAGSVADAPLQQYFMQMGADFIVSPVLNPEVARDLQQEEGPVDSRDAAPSPRFHRPRNLVPR